MLRRGALSALSQNSAIFFFAILMFVLLPCSCKHNQQNGYLEKAPVVIHRSFFVWQEERTKKRKPEGATSDFQEKLREHRKTQTELFPLSS
ncbi:MAG: hypothetical protein BA865_08485 [Desulfobacterales bacterium S5133MH4]|jgi:hypothetical protein|nr:MAG: hypothetical protein BA865_08485 [Desulfobacterales bacterium S5133MH4]